MPPRAEAQLSLRGGRGWVWQGTHGLGQAERGGIEGEVGAGSRTRQNEWRGSAEQEEAGARLGGSRKLSHLFGIAQLELAAVARPADAAVMCPVLE